MIAATETASEISNTTKLIEDIFFGSRDRIIQVSEGKAEEIIEGITSKIASQMEKYSPKPQTFRALINNVFYLMQNGEKPRQIMSAAVVDIKELNQDTHPETVEVKLLIKIAEKFFQNVSLLEKELSEMPKNESIYLIVEKLLANLKLKTGVTRQILFVKNFDLLEDIDQISLSELLLRHLSKEATINTIIFHKKPIKTYKRIDGGQHLGLEPDGGWPTSEKFD